MSGPTLIGTASMVTGALGGWVGWREASRLKALPLRGEGLLSIILLSSMMRTKLALLPNDQNFS